MIKRLRNHFIRIAILSVTAVLLLLCLIVNVANLLSTDAQLKDTLLMIQENRGEIPPVPPKGGIGAAGEGKGDLSGDDGSTVGGENTPPVGGGTWGGRHDSHLTPETPFSTRYFVLTYRTDGTLLQYDLSKIAAVTESDVDDYLKIALSHGAGFGYTHGYRFHVLQDTDGTCTAVFLDCHREVSGRLTILALSLSATAACIALVSVIVILCSRRAIDPVVRSYERQKQFITDASHELKTPITVIATSLKVLEMEVGKQKWIDKARLQTEKLTELVSSLVTLSRMDEERPLSVVRFPVGAAVVETAESFADYASSAGHPLEISVDRDAAFEGDEYAVRQLVSILLDNAVKYAAVGSPIRISLETVKHGILIRTENGCDNLTESDLDKLFDRFYRADKSRSAAGSGFGIGLSIARGIAEAHKGHMEVHLKKGEGENAPDTVVFTAVLKH